MLGMARDPLMAIEIAWTLRFGKPPRAFDEYDPLTVEALVFESKALEDGSLTMPDYDDPIVTDDPVVAAWERAIARGEVPDLTP